MNTLIDCSLNGVSLSSLDDALCVLDVKELAPKMRISALVTQPDGRRILRRFRESLSIEITCAIHHEEPEKRRLVQQQLHAWAEKGGLFTTTERPGQRIRMHCAQLPSMAAQDWQSPLTLTLVSGGVPYWEDAQTTAVTGSQVLTLDVPGTAESAPVSVVIINDTGAAVTRMNLYCAGSRMLFEGMNFAPGGLFTLTQEDGYLIADVDGESILPFRTPDSDDLLTVPCGKKSTVYVSADQPLTAAFAVRGRYV